MKIKELAYRMKFQVKERKSQRKIILWTYGKQEENKPKLENQLTVSM